MSFTGKVVLVTGASSGIGAAVAVEFAKEGAIVAMVGRNEEKLKKVSEEVENVGPKPLVVKADICNDDEAKNVVNEVISKYEKLDVLINNAGLTKFGSILEGNVLDAYDRTMEINVRAHVNMTALAAPFLATTKGNIVNVSSVAGSTVPLQPSMISYYVSKAALNQFSRCSALELSGRGVRVNAVCPGPVKTDFLENAGVGFMKFEDMRDLTALNRVSEAVEVADLVLFLAGPKAKGITGSEFVVDNGIILKH